MLKEEGVKMSLSNKDASKEIGNLTIQLSSMHNAGKMAKLSSENNFKCEECKKILRPRNLKIICFYTLIRSLINAKSVKKALFFPVHLRTTVSPMDRRAINVVSANIHQSMLAA